MGNEFWKKKSGAGIFLALIIVLELILFQVFPGWPFSELSGLLLGVCFGMPGVNLLFAFLAYEKQISFYRACLIYLVEWMATCFNDAKK